MGIFFSELLVLSPFSNLFFFTILGKASCFSLPPVSIILWIPSLFHPCCFLGASIAPVSPQKLWWWQWWHCFSEKHSCWGAVGVVLWHLHCWAMNSIFIVPLRSYLGDPLRHPCPPFPRLYSFLMPYWQASCDNNDSLHPEVTPTPHYTLPILPQPERGISVWAAWSSVLFFHSVT